MIKGVRDIGARGITEAAPQNHCGVFNDSSICPRITGVKFSRLEASALPIGLDKVVAILNIPWLVNQRSALSAGFKPVGNFNHLLYSFPEGRGVFLRWTQRWDGGMYFSNLYLVFSPNRVRHQVNHQPALPWDSHCVSNRGLRV